ncbi:MAG: AzlD domain-containing protein [Candidatus Norongarragalinales archaeon]
METEIIGLIMGIATLTFFTRFAFAAILRKTKISEKWERWLAYIPIAVFTTIIVPSLLAPNEKLELAIQNEYLIAGIIAFLVAYKTKNLAGTVLIGILTVLLLRVLLSF